jgi:hypothetical protein
MTEPPLYQLIEAYLRKQPGWREHPEHRGTYLQWEDLRATPNDWGRKSLTTDLAATRQLMYEAQDGGGHEHA